MNETNEKKVMPNVVALIIVLIVLILSVSVGVFIGKNYYKNNENNNETGENNNQNNKEINKIDDSKDIIYTLYEKTSGDYDIKIPYVNIDSNYAREINGKMEQAENDYQKYDESSKISYNYYINDNILSIYIKEFSPSASIYTFYNIDIYTGKKVSNTEILAYKKYDNEIFYTKLIDAVNNKVVEMMGSLENRYQDENYNNAYNQTMELYTSKDKIALINELTMYIDTNGNINVLAGICLNSGQIRDDGYIPPSYFVLELK